MTSTITRLLAALALSAATAWAAGAADPARLRLTPALLDRMEAASAELRKLPQLPDNKNDEGDKGDDDDAESVEDLARKLDAHPQIRAALARQGLTSREYAAATLAALHAGMVLAVEKAPGAKPAQQNMTPEQRANVEVMRARQKGRK